MLVDRGEGVRYHAEVDDQNQWVVSELPADVRGDEERALARDAANYVPRLGYLPVPQNRFAEAIVAQYPGSRILSGQYDPDPAPVTEGPVVY